MGDGIIDWTAFFNLYRKVCPKSLLQLEIITGRPPQILPYFEKDWWKWFPKIPASDFARFTALAGADRDRWPAFDGTDRRHLLWRVGALGRAVVCL